MSECGVDWLTAALDPFHDKQFKNLSGYPDAVTAPSVVRTIKRSLNISKPAGLPDGNWDASIVVWPWLAGAPLEKYTLAANNLTPGVGGAFPQSQVSVFCKASAVASMDYLQVPNFETGIGDDIIVGQGRLVSMGFEVVNTTAEIQKQGTVLVWRQPATPGPQEALSITGAEFGVITASLVSAPPESTDQVMLIPGTRQWKASEGCYLVVPFQSIENKPAQLNAIQPYFTQHGVDIPLAGSVDVMAAVNAESSRANVRNQLAPINQVGSYFTGLSEQTTLTVNVLWNYEYFPTFHDQVLLPLATPSCEYDPVALQFYVEVLNSLPVGVPFSWNAAGDWWWDVVSAIRNHAANVGKMIGGPVGYGLGEAAAKIAGHVQDNYMDAPGSFGPPKKAPKGRQQKKPNNNKPQGKKPPPPPRLTKTEQNRVNNAVAARLANARRQLADAKALV